MTDTEADRPPTPRKWQFKDFPNVKDALAFMNTHHLHMGAVSVTVHDQKVALVYLA